MFAILATTPSIRPFPLGTSQQSQFSYRACTSCLNGVSELTELTLDSWLCLDIMWNYIFSSIINQTYFSTWLLTGCFSFCYRTLFFFNGQGLEGSGKCGLGKELHDKASSQSGELCLMNCHWQARGQSHYPPERWWRLRRPVWMSLCASEFKLP